MWVKYWCFGANLNVNDKIFKEKLQILLLGAVNKENIKIKLSFNPIIARTRKKLGKKY